MKRSTRWLAVAASVLVLLTLGAPTALAAPVQGTVVATGYYTVRVVVVGKMPSWLKKQGSIMFLGVESYVTDIKADTVDVGAANAGAAKLGDIVTLKKWKKGQKGC